MFIKVKYVLIVILSLLTISLSADEEQYNDSLIQLINSSSDDTVKFDAFIELAKITQTSKPDQSVDITINALEIAKNIMSDEHIAKAYNQLGISYYHKGDLIQSKNFINNAYLLYRELDHKKGISSTLNGLGVLNYDQGELHLALENFNESLNYSKAISNYYGYAMTLNNIGNIYKDLKEFDKAIEYYNQSINEKQKIDDQLGIAMSLNNIGLVHHDKKEFDEALKNYEKSIEIKKRLEDKHGEAMSLHNIGWTHHIQGNYAKAMKYYQQALDMREILGDNFGSSMTLGNMSEVQKELQNYDKAIFYLNISLMKAEQIKAVKLLKDIYLELSEIQVLANDYENAYLNQKKYIEFTDSLLGVDAYKELSVLKAEMETQNAENSVNLLLKEREIQQLKSKRQSIINYALAACVVLLIILSFVIYLRNKDRIKQAQLQEQLTDISHMTDSYAVVTDVNDKIVWINDGFTKLLGYTLSDVQGKTADEVLRGNETDKKTIEFIDEKRKSKESFNTEILNYKKDGTPIWISVNATLVKNEHDEIERYIAFGTDITKRKNAERELKNLLS